MLSSAKSSPTTAAVKQRMAAEQEHKEQLSSPTHGSPAAILPQQRPSNEPAVQQPALHKRRVLVRRVPSPAEPAADVASPPPGGRRRVLLVRRPEQRDKQSPLPPLPIHNAASASNTLQATIPSPHMASVAVSSSGVSAIRERRSLSRVAASSAAFSAFQSALASRVDRPAAALCMTNASDEYRARMERAAVNEQEKRIARQAAAAHIDAKLTAADEEGGLPLPWEQSLRGATNHSVGVGGLFSGLYCKITQADMREMEILRSVKAITEQPTLATQPTNRAKAARIVRPMAAADTQHSAAATQLMDEAARLRQLSRLGTLGSKGRARATQQSGSTDREEQTAAQDEEDATLRLGDLIIRGTPLFDNLDPPSPSALARAAASDSKLALGHVSLNEADNTVVSPQANVDASLTFNLSSDSLTFQHVNFPHDKRSQHVTLHNSSRWSLHFAFSRLSHQSAFEMCSPGLPARSAFVLSHPVGHVLPLSSIAVCVTFCPPAAGVWVERWRLTQIDYDGESQPLADATFMLVGSSYPTLAPRNTAAASQWCHDSSGPSLLTSSVEQLGWQNAEVSASALSASHSPADVLSVAELRLAFCRANDSRRLHFHHWLLPEWLRLWHDVRRLHRPLDQQRMEWQLSAQQIEQAIERLPRRHKQRQSALTARLSELLALAAVRPAPHPARQTLLASLLSALATALPAFASQLRLVHKNSLPPPWENRARARETQLMALEDTAATAAMGRETDEQRQQRDGDGVDGEQQQQPLPAQQQPEEAARAHELEERADSEWRQRQSDYQQRLENESRLVIAAIVNAFEACAGAMGSDQPPPEAEQLSEDAPRAQLLPVAFPTLVVETEPEPVQEKGKARAVKAKK